MMPRPFSWVVTVKVESVVFMMSWNSSFNQHCHIFISIGHHLLILPVGILSQVLGAFLFSFIVLIELKKKPKHCLPANVTNLEHACFSNYSKIYIDTSPKVHSTLHSAVVAFFCVLSGMYFITVIIMQLLWGWLGENV